MINLLPPEVREDITYARKNTLLLRWVFILFIVIVAIFVVVFAGQIYIKQSQKSYESQISEVQNQLKVQKLEETKTKVESISGSIKLAVQVLSKQLLFSSILKQIGAAFPEGSVLTGLSINKLEGGIDLTAAATDYDTATQVQVNLQDPTNKIFEKADIISIQCNKADTQATNPNTGQSSASQIDILYPCKVSIRALFSSNNSFLFINNQGSNP
ncbi:hypothetical protein KDA00_04045 [Candidatus Saccharibacteria bacterium]|nr:hypothetical protein [Candidatus Saccharibacteria bacterium]